jgi:branched-chain amino acid transport system substrate-binding protein
MLKQARELGIKAVFAFGDGACTDKMKEFAGDKNAEGFICSQAGLPVAAASKDFLEAYKAKFSTDPILYAPFTYDAANLLIAAMQKADSTDPAKYLPDLEKISLDGASGHIEFDDKGDRKLAEITIFEEKTGKLEPIAVVKGGKSIPFDEFMKGASAAPAAAPAMAPATAPAEAMKAEPKK